MAHVLGHQIWSRHEHPKTSGVLVWSWPSVTSQISPPLLDTTARAPPWSSLSPMSIKIHFAPPKICTGGHDRSQWDEGMALSLALLPWSSCQGTAPGAPLINPCPNMLSQSNIQPQGDVHLPKIRVRSKEGREGRSGKRSLRPA